MTPTLHELKTAVAALPLTDRAALAHFLLGSLDDGGGHELSRRMARIGGTADGRGEGRQGCRDIG